MFTGVLDAVHLLREVLGKITDERRTHTVTRKQLSNAIDSLAALLDPIPLDAREWAARFVELREYAQTLEDIAQALAQELGEPPDSELRAWGEAVKNCIESNLRDACIAIPWLRLDPKEIVAIAGRSQENSPEWVAIESRFRRFPSLAEAAERFQLAIDDLAPVRQEFSADPAANREVLARVDALTVALKTSAKEAATLSKRLLAIADTSQAMFDAMDFSFLFDTSRKLFSIGYASGRRNFWMPAVTICLPPKPG